MRSTVVAGLIAGAVVGVILSAPASADDVTGTVTITFTKKTWRAINTEVVVKPAGKAEPAPQCCPCELPPTGEAPQGPGPCCSCRELAESVNSTCEAKAAGTGSFTMPGYFADKHTIAGQGGLTFVRATTSLKMENFVADLAGNTMSAKLVGISTDHQVFDLANVKRGTKVKAQLNLAMGEAATLNEALKTDIFTKRMRIGRFVYTPD